MRTVAATFGTPEGGKASIWNFFASHETQKVRGKGGVGHSRKMRGAAPDDLRNFGFRAGPFHPSSKNNDAISRSGSDMRTTQEKYHPIRRSDKAGAVLAALRVAQLSIGRAPFTMCPRAEKTDK